MIVPVRSMRQATVFPAQFGRDPAPGFKALSQIPYNSKVLQRGFSKKIGRERREWRQKQ
jgi:hypothetical protein